MRTFPSMQVFVQRLDHTIERSSLPLLCLPDKPDLGDVRSQLEDGPLGKVERDIFFPSWTKSIHVLQHDGSEDGDEPSWDDIEARKITVETAEELHKVLEKEEETPGSTSIILQQCRSKRYSRKKGEFSNPSSPSKHATSPVTPTLQGTAGANPPMIPDFRIPTGIQDAPIYRALPNQDLFDGQSGPIYFERYPPVSMFPPAPMYSPCYAVPVNVGYNYISPIPAIASPVLPTFYGYNM